MLDAEVKLGELLKEIPIKGKTKEYGSGGGTIPTLPESINKKQSHYYQAMAEHPDIVEEVKAENIDRKNFTPSEAVAVWEEIVSHQGKKELRSDSDRSEQPREQAVEITGLGVEKLSEAKAVVEYGRKLKVFNLKEVVGQILTDENQEKKHRNF